MNRISPPPRRPEAPFVGRAAELDRLAAAALAPPALVMLSGAAGMGKSRLVAELAVRLPQTRVLVGRCHRLRDPFPLGPIAEVIRDLGPDLAGCGLSPVTGALRTLVPELADLFPPVPDEPADRRSMRHLQFRAAVELLRTAGPAVLIVEDAHWVDAQTLEFLGYLLGDPPPGLSLVVTYRADEAAAPVPALAARLPAGLAVDRLELEPWGASATGAMAAGLLGVDEVSDAFAAHLCHRAAGIPLAVQELLRLLLERGTIARYDGEWLRRTIDELDVPAGVRDPVLERASMLDEDARQLVEAAAVLQLPVPLDLLARVADLPDEHRTAALEAAQRSGLLVERDRLLELVHVLAGQAVYDSLVPARQRWLHRSAATVLRCLPAPPLGQIAHHLYAADQTQDWIDTAEEAAVQAWEAGDDEEVVNLLAPALRADPPDPGQRLRIARRLVRSALYFPRGQEIADLLTSLPMHEFDPTDAADLSLSIAQLIHNIGNHPESVREFAGRAAEATGLPVDRRVEALGIVAYTFPTGMPRSDVLRGLDRLATLLPGSSGEEGQRASARVAAERLRFGDAAWRDVAPHAAVADVPATLPEAIGTYEIAEAAGMSGHYELARRRIRACLMADDKRILRPLLVAALRASSYEVDYWCGTWDGLESAILRNIGQPVTAGMRQSREQAVLGALKLSRVGPTDEVIGMLDQALTDSQLIAVAMAVGPRARAQRVRDCGRLPGLEVFLDAVASGMVLPCMYRPLAPLTRFLPTEQAVQLVEVMSRHAREVEAPLAAGALRQARGHLTAAAGRWAEASDHYLAAAAHHDAVLTPYDAAQAREAAAIAMLETRQPAASEVLRAAIEAYEGLGARWDLDRAAGLARRHGISVPARHRDGPRGYGDDLSPREREVADLAAAGHTNREIAEALFLSVSTVNKHLSAALRKRGVPSRRQLRDYQVIGRPSTG